MNIPQVLGYTRIAGTPVVTGLYTVLLPLVAFAVFGSSRHLVVSADSATAAISSNALSRMAPLASEKYMALVGMLTLLTAALLPASARLQVGPSRPPGRDDRLPEERSEEHNHNNAKDKIPRVATEGLVVGG